MLVLQKESFSVNLRLALIYILPIFTFSESLKTGISLLVFILIFSLMNKEEYLYCIPIQLFFYLQLVVMSIAVFRLYTLLYLVTIVKQRYLVKSSYKKNLIYVIIGLIFSICVIMPRELQRGIFLCLDILVLWSATSELTARGKTNIVLKYMVYAGVSAGVYGVITGAAYTTEEVLGGYYTTMSRYLATFNDVNYAGMFFNIAIISCISLKDTFKSKLVKYCVLIFLYIALFATLSTTALICNVLLLFFYHLLEHNKKMLRIFLFILIIVVAFRLIYLYGLNHADSTLGHLVYRVSDKFMELNNGNYSAFTSYRSDKTEEHLSYFLNQNIFKQLFGGNSISAAYTDSSVFTYAAHNEYIDLLLSVGIVGWIFYMGTYIIRFIFDFFSSICETDNTVFEQKRSILLVHACYLLYAATLTMFLDHRFLFIFFL